MDVSTPEKVLAALKVKIETLDVERAKEDVIGYLTDPTEIDIWSKDFFRQMSEKIVFV